MPIRWRLWRLENGRLWLILERISLRQGSGAEQRSREEREGKGKKTCGSRRR